jgi:hypothetical protein
MYLWNLEGPQPDERFELDDDIVSISCRRSAEVLDFIAKVSFLNTDERSCGPRVVCRSR